MRRGAGRRGAWFFRFTSAAASACGDRSAAVSFLEATCWFWPLWLLSLRATGCTARRRDRQSMVSGLSLQIESANAAVSPGKMPVVAAAQTC